MVEIRRLGGHRFVGARDTMLVYDTEAAGAAEELAARMLENDLLERDLLQTFGPDALAEARNRGFRPA